MKIFTKFGVWDKEVKEFIDKICAEVKLSKEDVADWFYSEGVLAFQKTQGETYPADVKVTQEIHKHRPNISLTYIVGQKFMGFMALLPKLIKFAQDDAALKNRITSIFNEFVTGAVHQHYPFYDIQANITTALNSKLDSSASTLSPDDTFKFIIIKFEEYKDKKPELTQEIDDHITLMNEFSSHMKKQQKAASSLSASTYGTFSTSSPKSQDAKENNKPITVDNRIEFELVYKV